MSESYTFRFMVHAIRVKGNTDHPHAQSTQAVILEALDRLRGYLGQNLSVEGSPENSHGHQTCQLMGAGSEQVQDSCCLCAHMLRVCGIL